MFRLLARKLQGPLQIPVYNNCATTNITTAAKVVLVASLAEAAAAISCQNSSTSTIGLYVGGAGVESLSYIMGPSSSIDIIPTDGNLPKGTRITLQAIDATASTGVVAVNFFGG